MTYKWEVVINGSAWDTKAARMHTAVNRAVKAHLQKHPKQAKEARIYVKRLEQV